MVTRLNCLLYANKPFGPSSHNILPLSPSGNTATLPGIVTLPRLQLSNALPAMAVTPSGME